MQIITNPELPAIPPMRTHVSLLPSDRIDQLVYSVIFKQSKLCHGRMEISARPNMLRCTECQALIVEAEAVRPFADTGHLRATPFFSTSIAPAWSIVGTLQPRDEATLTLFVLYLDLLVRDEHTRQHPGVPYSLLWYTVGITPRAIAIAALQAMGVVDSQGYLVEVEAKP
jgi:hypothetical protein